MESNCKKICDYPYMEEKNNMELIRKMSTEVNDVSNKAFTAKGCYKAQINSHINLLGEQKIANVKYKLQSEANDDLKERVNHNIANFDRLLSIENTCMIMNSNSIYSSNFLKDMYMVMRKRMETKMKTYNERWLRSKERIESLPLVQLLLQKQTVEKELVGDLELWKKRIILLKKSIISKKLLIDKTDNEKILKFAQFMIYERPKILDSIIITRRKIAEHIVIIDKLKAKDVSYSFVRGDKQYTSDNVSEIQENQSNDFEWSTTPIAIKNYNDEYTKLLSSISEMDVEPQLESALVRSPIINTPTIWTPEANRYTENDFRSYFAFKYFLDAKQDNVPSDVVPNQKQICFIDNKNVNEKEAQSILFSMNPKALKSDTSISFNYTQAKVSTEGGSCQQMETENTFIPMELDEMIEAVDHQFITPPTQFLDQSQNEEDMSQQEKTTDDYARRSANVNLEGRLRKSDNRKRVALNAPEEQEADNAAQKSFIPSKSDTSGSMMRADHFKKYKLDTTLHFTYAKSDRRKRTIDEHIKSKFSSDFDSLYKRNEEGKEYEKEVSFKLWKRILHEKK